jgi:hypothetical protein
VARSQKREQAVSDDELEEMDERVADHFDRVRDQLDAELNEGWTRSRRYCLFGWVCLIKCQD